MAKLWGGQFSDDPDDLVRALNDSFVFDQRLYAADIRGSVAYAGALQRAGLLTQDEHDRIVTGLNQVKAEFDSGTFEPGPDDEDIHTAVERRLTELTGAVAGKLHTGRSRNDQVALDLRLWLSDSIDDLRRLLTGVQRAIIEQAEKHLDLIMSGYTHLQPAQPVLFSHWLMSFFWMLERDQERLADCQKRVDVSPLGAGALAGNPFPIDRAQLAADLGMSAATPNSMDAVSDRDFVAEFLFVAALLGVHLSRLSEDLIIFSGPAYGFVTIGEAYTTGSSLMPQKRNPDIFELARGKSGRLLGHLVGLLTVLKGLPSTYNKDLQEDKESLFDVVDTLMMVLPVVGAAIQSLQPQGEKMLAALDESMLATDLADYLVERDIPFREAHGLIGQLVRLAEERNVTLSAVPLETYQSISPAFDADVYQVFDYQKAVARRSVLGGTAAESVRRQIADAQTRLSQR